MVISGVGLKNLHRMMNVATGAAHSPHATPAMNGIDQCMVSIFLQTVPSLQ